jgi:hypothetical protein
MTHSIITFSIKTLFIEYHYADCCLLFLFTLKYVSHCNMSLLLIRIQLLRSTFVFTCHFGAKTISSHTHLKDGSSPHISGSGSLIWIDLTFVLFKHVILMCINYLETWLRSDNTSCYYGCYTECRYAECHYSECCGAVKTTCPGQR